MLDDKNKGMPRDHDEDMEYDKNWGDDFKGQKGGQTGKNIEDLPEEDNGAISDMEE